MAPTTQRFATRETLCFLLEVNSVFRKAYRHCLIRWEPIGRRISSKDLRIVSCLSATSYETAVGPRRGKTASHGPIAIIGPVALEQLTDEELVMRTRTAPDAEERESCVNELFR